MENCIWKAIEGDYKSSYRVAYFDSSEKRIAYVEKDPSDGTYKISFHDSTETQNYSNLESAKNAVETYFVDKKEKPKKEAKELFAIIAFATVYMILFTHGSDVLKFFGGLAEYFK